MDTCSENQLRLYYTHSSFYSERALLALYEKKLTFDHRIVKLGEGEHYSTWFMKINPMCKVPVLQHGDSFIPDSFKIIEYLDTSFPHLPKLQPDSISGETHQMLTNVLDAFPSPIITFGSLFFPEFTKDSKIGEEERQLRLSFVPKIKTFIDKAMVDHPENNSILSTKGEAFENFCELITKKENFVKYLEDINEFLQTAENALVGPYLFGGEYTSADIQLTLALKRLQHTGLWWRYFTENKYPALKNYYELVQQRDSFKQLFG